MRLFLTAALMIISFSPALACAEFEQAMAELETKTGLSSATPIPGPTPEPGAVQTIETAPFLPTIISFDELKKWAETSTAGGGRVEQIIFRDQKLAFVYRGYTSGVKSTDIGIYQEKDGQWKLIKSHPVIMNDWVTARDSKNSVDFALEETGEEVMTLSASEILE